jgi:hypothetical protein
LEILKGRDNVEFLGVDGIILKWIVKIVLECGLVFSGSG